MSKVLNFSLFFILADKKNSFLYEDHSILLKIFFSKFLIAIKSSSFYPGTRYPDHYVGPKGPPHDDGKKRCF